MHVAAPLESRVNNKNLTIGVMGPLSVVYNILSILALLDVVDLRVTSPSRGFEPTF